MNVIPVTKNLVKQTIMIVEIGHSLVLKDNTMMKVLVREPGEKISRSVLNAGRN